MSFETKSKSFQALQRRFTPPPHHVQDEFMDSAGMYSFRAYLNGSEFGGQALEIVGEILAEIAGTQRGISNEQLYDELHARLCGPEPLEIDQLLAFMRLFVESLWKMIETIARSSQAESDETFPLGNPIQLSLAQIFPRQVLCFLQAIQLVSKESEKNGLILQLALFINCTDLEISRILDTTPEKVNIRRLQASKEVWSIYDTQFSGVKR